MNGNNRRPIVIIAILAGVIVVLVICLIGALVALNQPINPDPTATSAQSPVAQANCGGHQGNYTVIGMQVPASQLTVEIHLTGHKSPTTSSVEVYFYCDGNTVKFPDNDEITCNGKRLNYSPPSLLGIPISGPTPYVNDNIPALGEGTSYVITYRDGNGYNSSVTIPAEPVVITSPSASAPVPIPVNAPLTIHYYATSSSRYTISGFITDGAGHAFGLNTPTDSGTITFTAPPNVTPTEATQSVVNFTAGKGSITLTRKYTSPGNEVSGTPFGSVTLDYEESGSIPVNWT